MLAVAVALRPADFDFGAESPDGSPWQIFGERHETNPKHRLDDGDLQMVTVWAQYRQGHLPDAGGVLDQSAAMLEALGIMEDAAARILDPKQGIN